MLGGVLILGLLLPAALLLLCAGTVFAGAYLFGCMLKAIDDRLMVHRRLNRPMPFSARRLGA